jgi:hypothetical protein
MQFYLFGELIQPGVSNLENGLVLLFAFLIGHALADFPLQGSFLAIGKERHGGLEKITGTKWPPGTWAYCLTMHSLIHGGAVWIVSGSVRFGAAEFALHWLIDLAKSARLTNFYVDQGLHVLCKCVYVYLLLQ